MTAASCDSYENGRSAIELVDDAEIAALIVLGGLPSVTPSRLWSLLDLGPPTEVLAQVVADAAPRHGRANDAANRWSSWARQIDPGVELDRHRRHHVAVLPFGHDGYPDALLDDPDPPAVIFRQGPQQLDDRVRVAIVGTRRCTGYGRDVAHELGLQLAARGVDVVSGLATGIDAAAHAGSTTKDKSRAVAVVAGGVDVLYPRQNRGLFASVAQHGALLSEWPLGARPETWRFPARNRIVAALSAAVVVVESAKKGGSMYTVDEAITRNRAVFAVPGPIYSPVSVGTNQLIADGAHSLHCIDELLDAVAPQVDTTPQQTTLGIESWLLELVGWQPVALESIVADCGRPPSEVTLEVERLIGAGVLRRLGATVERAS